MTCISDCLQVTIPRGYESDCFFLCSNNCNTTCFNPPPPPPYSPVHKIWTHNPFTSIIPIVAGSLAGILLVYLLCLRYRRTRENRRTDEGRAAPSSDELTNDVHMLEIDHPIWHIRTVGLQESLIESIPLYKYKKEEGVIESTDCAVCLTEFEDDESLRFLPKCSHAFHLLCIDTWLKSHQNCPVCRAPVAAASNDSASSTAVNLSAEESHFINIGSSRESTVSSDEEGSEGSGETAAVLQTGQVSSSSGQNVCDGSDQCGADEAEEESKEARAKGKLRENWRISDSLSFRNLLGSSLGNQSLQMRPSSVVRSLSAGGKLGV